jgi:hypothetical protein
MGGTCSMHEKVEKYMNYNILIQKTDPKVCLGETGVDRSYY